MKGGCASSQNLESITYLESSAELSPWKLASVAASSSPLTPTVFPSFPSSPSCFLLLLSLLFLVIFPPSSSFLSSLLPLPLYCLLRPLSSHPLHPLPLLSRTPSPFSIFPSPLLQPLPSVSISSCPFSLFPFLLTPSLPVTSPFPLPPPSFQLTLFFSLPPFFFCPFILPFLFLVSPGIPSGHHGEGRPPL